MNAMPEPDAFAPTKAAMPLATPVELLMLGLGSGDDAVDLEAEIELGEFLCACPELELHGCLGRGGMGIVYRARQVRLDRDVAVKLMSPELGQDPEFAERFEREAKAMARLDHPGIVRVHDFGRAAGVYYLVMELVDGPNLRGLIEQGLEDAEALEIVGQLCDALAYAHEHGVVHRDIKPENVLVDRRGRVRVADFGLAKLQREVPGRATRTRRVLGTPQYMAPEQLRDPGAVDHRCDIFAIGVVFYEMLTGQLPVGRFPAPSELGRGNVRLDEIVLRALESNRDLRFGTASEIQAALSTLAGGAESIAGAGRPSPRRSGWLVGGAAVTGGAAVAGGALVWALAGGPAPADAPSLPRAASVDLETPPDSPAALEPFQQLNRWPARDLAVLDPDVVGVAGLDWSELRQAPLVLRLGAAALAERSEGFERCKEEVLDHTQKIVAAFTSTELRELVIHGDWEPERLRPCIDEIIRERAGMAAPEPTWAESPLGVHHRLVLELRDGKDSMTFSIAQGPNTVVISLREDITAPQLTAKLVGEETSIALRDRVVHEVDLSAPIWLFAEPDAGGLPMGMTMVSGGIEIWDKLGVDGRATFDDEAAATSAETLAVSYANILNAVPDFPSPPEITITRQGTTVRVQGTLDMPEFDLKGRHMSLSLGTPPEIETLEDDATVSAAFSVEHGSR